MGWCTLVNGQTGKQLAGTNYRPAGAVSVGDVLAEVALIAWAATLLCVIALLAGLGLARVVSGRRTKDEGRKSSEGSRAGPLLRPSMSGVPSGPRTIVFRRVYSPELAGEAVPDELSLLAVSLLASAFSAEAGLSPCLLPLLLLFRLSVIYQPLPLNMTPTGWKTRRNALRPHSGQSFNGSAVIGCIFSNLLPHSLHSYSYMGILEFFLLLAVPCTCYSIRNRR